MRAITKVTDFFKAEKIIEEIPSGQEMETKDEVKGLEFMGIRREPSIDRGDYSVSLSHIDRHKGSILH